MSVRSSGITDLANVRPSAATVVDVCEPCNEADLTGDTRIQELVHGQCQRWQAREIGLEQQDPDAAAYATPGDQSARQLRDDRRTNTWRSATWDEALDFIGTRMKAVEPEAVGLWAGQGGFTNRVT